MDLFKEHTCDAIVAVGGGSPIDGSKAILYSIQLERGSPTPKQIAIPTTLSAAEYSVSHMDPGRCFHSSEPMCTPDRRWFHRRSGQQSCRLFSRLGSIRRHSRRRTDSRYSGASVVRCSKKACSPVKISDGSIGFPLGFALWIMLLVSTIISCKATSTV